MRIVDESFKVALFKAVAIIALAAFAAGAYIGSLIGANVNMSDVVDSCVKSERFYDRELRYFCTPWPADKPIEEDTSADDEVDTTTLAWYKDTPHN